jgi:NAD-dependent dihydropyrimidine dehydrogenase PreA subunit
MNYYKYIIINIVETLLRVIPFPCKTGLVKIGKPDRNSPVFLTCNYHLTVERVKKAVKGLNAYLLVANSKGDNVWCSASGGHFTNHSVISVLKTSGIEKLVDHRNVILPQLAATGIEGKSVRNKTGWKVIWGPVYAKDILEFVDKNFTKSPGMSKVEFPLAQRIEMAAMWAFPFSVIASLLVLPFKTEILLPLNILIWGWSLLIFVSFPLYGDWLVRKKKTTKFSKYTVIFDFSLVPIIIWLIFLSFLIIWGISFKNFNIEFVLGWGFTSLAILFLINIDLMGSTPLYKSGLHEDRFLRIILNKEKCKGAGYCGEVCPKSCFDVNKAGHTASIPRANECVQCGACIVQCPYDALYFKSPKGEILSPESVRKFKLNLVGKRLVKIKQD